MRPKLVEVPKHVHQWKLYTPAIDMKQHSGFGGGPGRMDPDPWAHRKCACGIKMRVPTKSLEPYPVDVRAFADEEWIDER